MATNGFGIVSIIFISFYEFSIFYLRHRPEYVTIVAIRHHVCKYIKLFVLPPVNLENISTMGKTMSFRQQINSYFFAFIFYFIIYMYLCRRI